MAFTNLTPVSFQKVGIRDGFWKKRIHAVCTETARLCIDQCEKTHRIDNFRRAAGWQAGGHEGIYFNDSDVYKVLEGVAYVLMTERDEKLEAKADEIIDAICAAQQPDGYLYTFYTLSGAGQTCPSTRPTVWATWSRAPSPMRRRRARTNGSGPPSAPWSR